MDIARREALAVAPEGTAVFAEKQTAGRGRLKRQWITPAGNIAVSIILYPHRDHLNSLIMLGSLAVKNVITPLVGADCRIKWPNDIHIGGSKVCGILIETKAHPDRLDYAILGIGINVNMRAKDHPEIASIATSLADATGRSWSRGALLRRLFTELEGLYTRLKAGAPLYPEWCASLSTTGRQVTVQSGDDVSEGVAESVNEDGSLNLRRPDGNLLRVTIGDVSLRETQSPEVKSQDRSY